MMIQKLDILKESNMIDQKIYDYVVQAMNYLSEQGFVPDNSPPTEAFLTHLAIAAARQKSNEPPIERLDTIIREDVEQSPDFPRVVAIWEKVAELSPVTFGEEERDYFYLHLCNMLQ